MDNVKRILIAEDTPEWQKFHAELLKNYDKAVLDFVITDCAKDAKEILINNKENPFDLILTDLQMEADFQPDFAGEWLVKEIKNIKEYSKTPIVIISATYNIGFIAYNLSVDYLSKRSLVNNPDSYYLESAILCMSSSSEGFGMVLLEAQKNYCVPIAYDSFGAVEDIISSGKTGEIVSSFDENEYMKKLMHLMRDTNYREMLAKEAYLSVTRYKASTIAKQWILLFEKLK